MVEESLPNDYDWFIDQVQNSFSIKLISHKTSNTPNLVYDSHLNRNENF